MFVYLLCFLDSKEQWLRRSRRAYRSYPTLKARKGSGEEIPLVQCKQQRLCYAGEGSGGGAGRTGKWSVIFRCQFYGPHPPPGETSDPRQSWPWLGPRQQRPSLDLSKHSLASPLWGPLLQWRWGGPFRAIDKPPGSLPLMGKKTLHFSSLLAPLNLMLVPRVLGFRGWLPSQRDHYTHFCLSRPESEIIFLHSRDSGKEREGARRGMSWLNNKNGSLKKKTNTNSYSKFPFVKDWFPAILCFNTGNWREFLPRLSRSQTTQST